MDKEENKRRAMRADMNASKQGLDTKAQINLIKYQIY